MIEYKAEDKADLSFSFPDDLMWQELDTQGQKQPQGMKFVDFVIEREDDILLVEVKDPSDTKSTEKCRTHFVKELENETLIAHQLVPKARCSYTALHLWEKDTKPFKYVVLLGLDACNIPQESATLIAFKDRLQARIKNEAEIPWLRDYIQDCIVLTVDTWNTVFPAWPVRRLSQGLMTMDEACGLR